MAAPLRNKPIDRRRLSYKDRYDYNRSGYRDDRAGEKRVRRMAGQRLAQLNSRPNTTDQFVRPGDYLGDFKPGIQTQIQRNRKASADKKRSESLRPTRVKAPESVRAVGIADRER